MDAETQAKLQQGYIEGLKPTICAYCDFFTGHPPEKPHIWLSAERRVHQRCLLGGFHAKPGATCHEWRPRPKTEVSSCPPSPTPGPEAPPRRAA